MLFFSKKKYPDFYQEYLNAFTTQKASLDTLRFVVFDTETTGLDTTADRVLSIGCIAVQNFSIHISDQLELYVHQEKYERNSVKIHGLLKKGTQTKVNEFDALQHFLGYIKNSVLVAHHAAFDIAMMNQILKRHNLPKLKNKVIDTGYFYKKTKYVKDNKQYGLDDLCKEFQLKMHDRHTASGDAYLTALVFLKTIKRLQKKKKKLRRSDFLGWL